MNVFFSKIKMRLLEKTLSVVCRFALFVFCRKCEVGSNSRDPPRICIRIECTFDEFFNFSTWELCGSIEYFLVGNVDVLAFCLFSFLTNIDHFFLMKMKNIQSVIIFL